MLKSAINGFISSLLLLSVINTNILTTANNTNISKCTVKYDLPFRPRTEPLINITSCQQTPHEVNGEAKLLLRQTIDGSNPNITLPLLKVNLSDEFENFKILLTGGRITHMLELLSSEILDRNITYEVEIRIQYKESPTSGKYDLSVSLKDLDSLDDLGEQNDTMSSYNYNEGSASGDSDTATNDFTKQCISQQIHSTMKATRVDVIVSGGSTWEMTPNESNNCPSTTTPSTSTQSFTIPSTLTSSSDNESFTIPSTLTSSSDNDRVPRLYDNPNQNKSTDDQSNPGDSNFDGTNQNVPTSNSNRSDVQPLTSTTPLSPPQKVPTPRTDDDSGGSNPLLPTPTTTPPSPSGPGAHTNEDSNNTTVIVVSVICVFIVLIVLAIVCYFVYPRLNLKGIYGITESTYEGQSSVGLRDSHYNNTALVQNAEKSPQTNQNTNVDSTPMGIANDTAPLVATNDAPASVACAATAASQIEQMTKTEVINEKDVPVKEENTNETSSDEMDDKATKEEVKENPNTATNSIKKSSEVETDDKQKDDLKDKQDDSSEDKKSNSTDEGKTTEDQSPLVPTTATTHEPQSLNTSKDEADDIQKDDTKDDQADDSTKQEEKKCDKDKDNIDEKKDSTSIDETKEPDDQQLLQTDGEASSVKQEDTNADIIVQNDDAKPSDIKSSKLSPIEEGYTNLTMSDLDDD